MEKRETPNGAGLEGSFREKGQVVEVAVEDGLNERRNGVKAVFIHNRDNIRHPFFH